MCGDLGAIVGASAPSVRFVLIGYRATFAVGVLGELASVSCLCVGVRGV